MELYENIIENNPVNEVEDYNDFVNRRRSNKKSIRTKVTTLKDNGEVVSEILGTKSDEELKSPENVNNNTNTNTNTETTAKPKQEIVSKTESISNGDNASLSNTVKPQEKNDIKSDTTKDIDTKNKGSEVKTVFGMKPAYGYTLVTIVCLVGLVATVKIMKNKSVKNVLQLN